MMSKAGQNMNEAQRALDVVLGGETKKARTTGSQEGLGRSHFVWVIQYSLQDGMPVKRNLPHRIHPLLGAFQERGKPGLRKPGPKRNPRFQSSGPGGSGQASRHQVLEDFEKTPHQMLEDLIHLWP